MIQSAHRLPPVGGPRPLILFLPFLTLMLCPWAALWAQTEVTLTPQQDTSLFEEGALSNGGGEYIFTGTTAMGSRRRALLQFDLEPIPPGASIDSARLELTMSRTISGTLTVRLHRVLPAWTAGSVDAPGPEGTGAAAALGDATWNHRSQPSLPWANAGGDFTAIASAATPVRDIGVYTWSSVQLVADVQAWVDTSASNQGWILIGNESAGFGTAKRFGSGEHSSPDQRPRLVVTFSGGLPPPPPSAIPVMHAWGAVLAVLLLLGLGLRAIASRN